MGNPSMLSQQPQFGSVHWAVISFLVGLAIGSAMCISKVQSLESKLENEKVATRKLNNYLENAQFRIVELTKQIDE